MTELVVGQKLWYVSRSGYARQREVTVAKVGRKWATVKDDFKWTRIDKETLCADDGYSSGRFYLSRETYDTAQRVASMWDDFNRKVREKYGIPSGVTAEAIQTAADALGITLDEAQP